MKKTIKEIYNYDFIKNPDTSLLKDINNILGKTVDELGTHDICVLIRQEMFLDTAIPKAIEIIKNNHSAGDYYDYCLLVNLSKINASLSNYKDSLLSLITVLEKDFSNIKFEFESEKEDYLDSIKRLKAIS